MSVPATANEFLLLANKSGLLDPEILAEQVPDESSLPSDPLACAAALVEAGVLTEFQADQLLAGRFRGMVLGSYRVLSPLGSGVYLADHAALRRKVALKVLPVEEAKYPKALEQFYREARAAAALDHPNIVRLHDVSQGAGVHFLVMEYVEGTDLRSVLEEAGPLPVERAVRYVAQVAAGLQHAHDKGFVHGAIKPGCLLVTDGGRVKVLGTGLAQSYRIGSEPVVGETGFAAPEQEKNELPDERSDVYGLGATLFALLTGKPPASDGSNVRTASIPPGLMEVIAKMMDRVKGGRYKSAAAVIDALVPWLPAGVTARDVTTRGDLRGASAPTVRAVLPKTGRKEPEGNGNKKKLLIGGAIAAVMLVGGLIVVVAASGGTSPPTGSAAATRPVAVSSTPPAPVTVTTGRYLPLSLNKVANITTAQYLLGNPDEKTRLVFRDYSPKEFKGVPFHVIDPREGAMNNAVALYSANRPEVTGQYPKSFKLPMDGPAAAVHVLGGVAGWGWPYKQSADSRSLPGSPEGTATVLVRFRYADGKTEEHMWRNGEHFTDYNRVFDAPGSELAFELEKGRYVRYLVVRPKRGVAIREVEFAKAPEDEFTAPMFLAVTVERP